MYSVPKSEPIYSVKIELEIETYVLRRKGDKEEKGELEGKV